MHKDVIPPLKFRGLQLWSSSKSYYSSFLVITLIYSSFIQDSLDRLRNARVFSYVDVQSDTGQLSWTNWIELRTRPVTKNDGLSFIWNKTSHGLSIEMTS